MQDGKIIGVSGHQDREGLDWLWVRRAIAELMRVEKPAYALSSLAVGSDQVFAEEALRSGASLKAVVPFAGYERCFHGNGLDEYRRLLARCVQTITLVHTGSDEQQFLDAGKRVADDCDLLVAVWDGEPAAGLGGTADIVAHALASNKDVVHLDPFSRSVTRVPVNALSVDGGRRVIP